MQNCLQSHPFRTNCTVEFTIRGRQELVPQPNNFELQHLRSPTSSASTNITEYDIPRFQYINQKSSTMGCGPSKPQRISRRPRSERRASPGPSEASEAIELPELPEGSWMRGSRRENRGTNRSGCQVEETFYPLCQARGHSTVQCVNQDPDHICDGNCDEILWHTLSTDDDRCPKCEDVAKAKASMSRDAAVKYIKNYGYGYQRQPHSRITKR